MNCAEKLLEPNKAVIDGGVPVYMAIKEHVVALTTLRDLVDNRVTIDCTK